MFTQLMDYRERFAERHQRAGERVYLFILAVFLIIQFLSGSLWFTHFHQQAMWGIFYDAEKFLMVCALLKIVLFDRFNDWKEPALFITTTIIVWVGSRFARTNTFIAYFIFIYAARGINFKKIVQVFLGTVGTLLLVSVIGAVLGIFPNVTITRGLGTNLRFAMGMDYTTDFAARIFYLCMAYVALRRFRLTLPEKISLFVIILWTGIVTGARLDILLMLMLLGTVVFYRQTVQLINWLGSRGLLVIQGLGILGIFLMSILFNPNNRVLAAVNHLLSGRLIEGHLAFKNYSVNLFGQYIAEQGNGGFHPHIVHYFFIDSSYLAALLKNGAVTFMLLLILIVFVTKRLVKAHAYPLVIVMFLTVISSIIDQHLPELSFDFIFLVTMANIAYFVVDKQSLVTNKKQGN